MADNELLSRYEELSVRYEKLQREMTKMLRISDAQSLTLIRVKSRA